MTKKVGTARLSMGRITYSGKMGGDNGRAMNMNVHNQECHEELHDIKPRYDFLWLHEILDILILISFLLNKQ